MLIHAAEPLFAWGELEDHPTLVTIRDFLDAVPDRASPLAGTVARRAGNAVGVAKIAVTGGSGEAGRAVVGDLVEHGHDVLNIDQAPSPQSSSPESPIPSPADTQTPASPA